MLQTPKIAAYVQKASLEGKEDKKFVRFTFYITPVTKDLADEVSSAIANLLFKKDASGNFVPVQEMDSAEFAIGNIPLQTMEMHSIDDPAMDLHGVMLTGVQISEISARKIFTDKPDFTLIFRAEVSKDSLAVQMMDKYFREKVHLTFAQMQGEMFPSADVKDTITNPECDHCGERAIYRDAEKKYWCQKDVRRSTCEVTMLVTKETPAQAQERILKERGKTAPTSDEQPSLVLGGKIAPMENDDTSHINRPRGGKTKRKEAVN